MDKEMSDKLDAIKTHLDSLHTKIDSVDKDCKDAKGRMDGMAEWQARSDAAEKERADKARADSEAKEKDEKEKADKARADAEAKDKDDKEKSDKARADAAEKERADKAAAAASQNSDFAKELDILRKQMPAVLSADDKNKYAAAQLRLDAAFQAWGKPARGPLHGESLRDYRLSLLTELKAHSKIYKDSNLSLVGDDAAFDSIESAIINDAVAASNVHIANGAPLSKRTRVNEHGHKITTFHGDAGIAWAPFMGGGTQFGKINSQPR